MLGSNRHLQPYKVSQMSPHGNMPGLTLRGAPPFAADYSGFTKFKWRREGEKKKEKKRKTEKRRQSIRPEGRTGNRLWSPFLTSVCGSCLVLIRRRARWNQTLISEGLMGRI